MLRADVRVRNRTLENKLDHGQSCAMRRCLQTVGLVACAVIGSGCSGSSSGASCAPGFHEDNGRCEPDLFDGGRGTGGSDGGTDGGECTEACGDRQECDRDATPPSCKCIPGYAGETCGWSGVIADPEFQDPDQWTATNGAIVRPFETGLAQGIGRFDPSVVCNGGKLSQTLDMPDIGAGEPLVAEVTYRTLSLFGVQGVGLGVGFDRAFRTLPGTVGESWSAVRFCLGEAASGEAVEFQVGPSEKPRSCFETEQEAIEVDAIRILLADDGECPAPGTALNAQAELGESDWGFHVEDGSGEGVSEASLRLGFGHNGTTGARIFQSADATHRASMVTQLSVRSTSSVASPALRFWWRGSPESRFRVDIGTYVSPRFALRTLAPLIGGGGERTSTYCLPPWTHGNLVDLSFSVSEGAPASDNELVVDNVEIVSDPRCGSNADLLDPGLDAAPNRWPGAAEFGTQSDTESVAIVDDADLARSGRGALEVTYSNNRAKVRVQLWVWVPPSQGDEGPALFFYSHVPPLAQGQAEPTTTTQWLRGRAQVIQADILPGGEWRSNRVCLPKRWSGRWFRLNLAVGPSGAPFAEVDPPEKVYFDDFELTTSPACTEE